MPEMEGLTAGNSSCGGLVRFCDFFGNSDRICNMLTLDSGIMKL